MSSSRHSTSCARRSFSLANLTSARFDLVARVDTDIAGALAPPSRSRHHADSSSRSLLVQIDFLRVIMDEAQMVGDAVSLTSETASLIPRQFSFAVTSTPLKARIEDLQGLLAFLRIEPFASSRSSLARLLEEVPSFVRGTSNYGYCMCCGVLTLLLYTVCESLGARTLKAEVEHELVIPDQSRFVVPVDFSAVEKCA
jgi:E3 ubiquitin-protein ligase SHPRH